MMSPSCRPSQIFLLLYKCHFWPYNRNKLLKYFIIIVAVLQMKSLLLKIIVAISGSGTSTFFPLEGAACELFINEDS